MIDKVLIICYDYLPLISPNSFRWSSIAEYWVSKQAYEVHVICAWKPGFHRKEILNGVNVYRVGGLFIETIRNYVTKKCDPIGLNKINIINNITIKQKLIILLKWFHDLTWKKIYWPDYACLWFFPAKKKAIEIIKEKKIKRLISVSFPFTGHLVGYFIKKKNSKTTWITDIIDPSFFPNFSPTNNHLLYSGLNKIIERKIIHKAQSVSVLTKSIQERYSVLFPKYANKITINPNLLFYKKVKGSKRLLFKDDQKIRLVFIGTLNKRIRSPEHLLKIFQMLLKTRIAEKLELHFFGGVDYCLDQFEPYQELINKKIFLHGLVSREKAILAMYSADILLNIGNSNPYQEPSKVIEYASTGKPIVNIITIHNDSSTKLLEKYPAALNIFFPILEKDSMQILKLVEFIENPQLIEKNFIGKLLKPYKIENVAHTYQLMLHKGEIE